MYPLFNYWIPNFTAANPSIIVNPGSTGSGTGQSQAEHGLVQIGASDPYLNAAQSTQYPWILNIPLAISAQQVNYNVPGIPATMHLNFSGTLLSEIYNGTITYWDNQAIKAANPAATCLLPHLLIKPTYRTDSSGDTSIFTQYLSASDVWWNRTVGFGTTVHWPSNPADTTGTGNSGMLTTCQNTPGCVAYIGISYLTKANNAGLGYGYLKNQAGNYVDISATNIQSAVNSVPSVPTNEKISLIYTPGMDSYPIVNFEYAMVAVNQTSSSVVTALHTFLSWAISPTEGNSAYFLNKVNFVPLPSSVMTLSQNQINMISTAAYTATTSATSTASGSS